MHFTISCLSVSSISFLSISASVAVCLFHSFPWCFSQFLLFLSLAHSEYESIAPSLGRLDWLLALCMIGCSDRLRCRHHAWWLDLGQSFIFYATFFFILGIWNKNVHAGNWIILMEIYVYGQGLSFLCWLWFNDYTSIVNSSMHIGLY